MLECGSRRYDVRDGTAVAPRVTRFLELPQHSECSVIFAVSPVSFSLDQTWTLVKRLALTCQPRPRCRLLTRPRSKRTGRPAAKSPARRARGTTGHRHPHALPATRRQSWLGRGGRAAASAARATSMMRSPSRSASAASARSGFSRAARPLGAAQCGPLAGSPGIGGRRAASTRATPVRRPAWRAPGLAAARRSLRCMARATRCSPSSCGSRRVGGAGRAVLHVLLLDARLSRATWGGDVRGDTASTYGRGVIASVANSLADQVAAP